MNSEINTITFVLIIIIKWSNGYFLGEKEGDVNYMQCWQNNKLMAYCPNGLSLNWNLHLNDTLYHLMPHLIKINLTWSSEFESKVVLNSSTINYLIPHININACQYELGQVCTPFIQPNNDTVIGTQPIQSNITGIFNSSLSLISSEWNIILHVILYLNDSTYYPLANEIRDIYEDQQCLLNKTNNITQPWKLDIAIGMAHHVMEIMNHNNMNHHVMNVQVEGWIFFVGIVIILSFAFAAYRIIKHFNAEYRIKVQNIETKLAAEKKLKGQLIIEFVTILISLIIGTFDWSSDTWALYDVQQQNHSSVYIVDAYFVFVMIITICYFYTVYMTAKDIFAIISEYRHGINNVVDLFDQLEKNEITSNITPVSNKFVNGISGTCTPINYDTDNDDDDDTENDNEYLQTPETKLNKQQTLQLIRNGNINFEVSRIERGIREEKINIIMCMAEDIPMFIFNGILLFYCHIVSTGIMVSFIINCLMLGYKVAGIERLWYLIQLKSKVNSMLAAAKLSRNVTQQSAAKSAKKIGKILIHNDSKYAQSEESSFKESIEKSIKKKYSLKRNHVVDDDHISK